MNRMDETYDTTTNNNVEMTDAEKNNKTVPADSSRSSLNNHDEITEMNIKHLIDLLHEIEKNTKSKKKSSWSDVNGISCRCQQYIQRYTDYHKLYTSPDLFYNKYVAGLIELLRESFLSHQWTDAIRIVHILVGETTRITDILWKTGMMSLIMEKKPMSIDLYRRQLCLITTSPIEVLFDYMLYLLIEGDLDRADGLSKDFALINIKKTQRANCESGEIMFRAYLGFIHYLHWRAEINQGDTEDTTAVDFISTRLSQQISQVSKESKCKAKTALNNMSCIRGVPGVWDIFIVKMMEIHEFYNDLDAAKSLLEDYKVHNPDNLNAHRYLYEFERKHMETKDQHLDSLQNIIRLDPSNPLALELYEEVVSSDPEAVSILFDYLDFDHCKNDLQAWTLLRTYLLDENDMEGTNAAVTKCWVSRRDWWPSACLQTDDDSIDELSNVKRTVGKRLKKYLVP